MNTTKTVSLYTITIQERGDEGARHHTVAAVDAEQAIDMALSIDRCGGGLHDGAVLRAYTGDSAPQTHMRTLLVERVLTV